jgi:hypothetical protein
MCCIMHGYWLTTFIFSTLQPHSAFASFFYTSTLSFAPRHSKVTTTLQLPCLTSRPTASRSVTNHASVITAYHDRALTHVHGARLLQASEILAQLSESFAKQSDAEKQATIKKVCTMFMSMSMPMPAFHVPYWGLAEA